MKFPKSPPDFQSLIKEIGPEGVTRILVAASVATLQDDYLHWDELRRRQAPQGLSTREWWLALKMRRTSQWRAFPLLDKSGHPFRYALPEKVLELLHVIDREASGRIEIPEFSEQLSSPHLRDRYIVSSLMEEAITSSQLEGAATTRKVAKEMLRTGRSPRTTGERMIVDNFRAIQQIRRLQKEPLSPALVLELHRIGTKGTLQDPSAAGRLRRSDDVVVAAHDQVLHQPPPFVELEERMALMCSFANGETPDHYVPPVVRAILLHFWLAYDHPFEDGNGRTARALFYWSMLHQGYWLFEFLSISRLIKQAPARYYRSFLHVETDDNDATYFLLCQLDLVHRALDELRKYLARKTRELRQTERKLRDVPDLNHRQLALLGHASRHPGAEYSFESHRASHGVVYQTARTDLLYLVEKGLLVKRKRGRTYVFAPAANLSDRLVALVGGS